MPKLNLREPGGSGRAVVETVTRALSKAAAVYHHRALHFSDVAEALWRETGRRTWTAAPVSGVVRTASTTRSTLSTSGRAFLGEKWRACRAAKVTPRICAALLLALHACGGSAETEREPDITVTAERVGKWEMSFEDMEFVARAIKCGKRLYSDGQKRTAWPYLKMGARHGDIDSQYMAAIMLGVGEDVPKDWNAAVGWLGVAAEGNIKPMAQKRLRETKEALCGGRTDCEQGFGNVVAEYRHRYGRRATGMACRAIKRRRGWSLRLNRGSRTVECKFARLLVDRVVLADAELEAVMGGAVSEPELDRIGTVRPELATAYPGRLEFALRKPRSPGKRRIRCPDLGDAD